MAKLFSYGTLQFQSVQIDTFGRLLTGIKEKLVGYTLTEIKITDPKVIASSGTDIHPMLQHTGHTADFVVGTLFELTTKELLQADSYEVDDYKRAEMVFESGEIGFVYLKNE